MRILNHLYVATKSRVHFACPLIIKDIFMKGILVFVIIICFTINVVQSQVSEKKEGKYLVGFNYIFPFGVAPATALSTEGGPYDKSLGFGVMIQRKITGKINIFFDISMYNYNLSLAEEGKTIQSIWTVEQSAMHWDEPGAPHQQYAGPFTTDVHFDMLTTGIRLGGRYYFGDKKLRPWVGIAFGLYEWEAKYFNGEKDITYGSDRNYIPGFSCLAGVDLKMMDYMVITAFADLLSPVTNYKMEGLFFPQWDINYSSHIMGFYRFGINISFASTPLVKEK
jgi:hypothetical protein